ncbi:amino acid adenylation domain-containing protein [Salmonella enterica]|nr:amino acid adenylation domain-containing protein [Salmonella enterica]
MENVHQKLAAELPDIISEYTGINISEIDENANLIGLGIDSITMMRISGRLRQQGVMIGFHELISSPNLSAWKNLLLNASVQIKQDDMRPVSDEIRKDNKSLDLAPMQHAYWIGRRKEQYLGGVTSHFYHEFDAKDIDPNRLERAVSRLMERHGMLRVSVSDEGQQFIPEKLSTKRLVVHDLRLVSHEQVLRHLKAVREYLSVRQMMVNKGEVFDIQLTLIPEGICSGNARIHIGMDMIAADAMSLRILLSDLEKLYCEKPLPDLEYTYFAWLEDYRKEQCKPGNRAYYDLSQKYWSNRLADLPGPAQLPTISLTGSIPANNVVRRHVWIDAEKRKILEQAANRHQITMAFSLASAFAEIVTAFSDVPDFLVNLPLFNRQALHHQVEHLVGDFTSSVLLAWNGSTPGSFCERARRFQQRFHEDVIYANYSGIELLRALSRYHDEPVYAPIVFTSALGLGELFSHDVRALFGEPVWIVSQGPQVLLDIQISELNGGLLINWDAREAAFLPGTLDLMFAAYTELVEKLIIQPESWFNPVRTIVTKNVQEKRRRLLTLSSEKSSLLHDNFFIRALQNPEHPALLRDDITLSYSSLSEWSRQIAALLVRRGMLPGERVAVSLPKGPGQIAAVLGVLFAGGVYVPVGIDQPTVRRQRIYQSANIRWQIGTESDGETKFTPDEAREMDALDDGIRVEPESEAYIIFTSGSTGEPKGVIVSHAAAVNTLEDINRRFGVTAQDRLLAVSALEFDLSVYDIFGVLGAGASLVLIDEATRRDATAWLKSIKQYGVTIWNSVPVLLEMLLNVAEGGGMLPGLRLALISGDWIGLNLPGWLKRIAPQCRFAALGGATEAAVWSNLYEVDEIGPEWKSIPYGYPLTNQSYRVVDRLGRDCPDWVAGELWIGGRGVALGYCGDPEKSAEKFVVDEQGKRWYRTGDIGRYWPDGTLEFLGRQDQQIKIRGHRIEPGEIEAALCSDPSVGGAIVVKGNEQGGETLIAGVVPAVCPTSGLLFDMCSVGILPDTSFESEIVDSILIDLLGFREHENLSISETATPLYNLWISWLKRRGRLIEDDYGKLHLSDLPVCIPEPVNEEQKHITGIANAVIRRIDDYRNILCGDLDARVLLDDTILAPEILMNNDPDIIRVQNIWATILRERTRALGRTLNVVELGGRSGLFAERLLNLLDGVDVNYTLLDASSTLVSEAGQRLNAHNVRQLSSGSVPETLLYQFDVVLCVNSLHRYRNAEEGVIVASLLLKHGGLLLATEFSHLSPLALFTSAVLEMGYTDFDTERRQAGSPTLSGSRWCKLLGAAWFDKCTSHYVGRSFLMDIEAVRASDSPEIHPQNLFQKLRLGLPEFMLPGKIVILPVMPLSINGKRDGSFLTRIASSYSQDNSSVPPESEMELWVAEIWKALLNTEISDKKQGFFDIGGDSLMATRFLAQVRQLLGVDMSMSQLFMCPTLNLVAEHLQNMLSEQCKQDDDEGKI